MIDGPVARFLNRIERGLGHRLAPYLFAIATVALIGWLWGSLNPLPWVYDEAAYLLQAKIFATGHWAAAGRPLPEFFEQVHVLVTPKLVPKYPPGHALLMVPGIWLGASALVPLLFTMVTGGLVFGFSRALVNPWVGGLTWLVWITAPEELYIRPSYLSETSTTLIWLLAWWTLSRWRKGGAPRWLAATGALAGLGLLVRPITALALLLPILVVVMGDCARKRRWRDLVGPIVAAAPIVALAPIWSYQTSGRVYPTPYSEYSRVYVPWNMPGFTVDTSPPLRPPIPALEKFKREWLPTHRAHTLPNLPAIVWERLAGIGETMWGGGWRWILLGGVVAGLAAIPGELGLVLVSGGVLFGAMLWLASKPLWTVYYLEVFPALAMVTAIGTWRIAGWIATRINRPWVGPALLVGGALVSVPGIAHRVALAKEDQVDFRLVATDLARAIDSIPGKAIIFIYPGPSHRPYESYVTNEPDLDATRVWVVHDRGDDNERLRRLAPDRAAYRFDPGDGSLHPLEPLR